MQPTNNVTAPAARAPVVTRDSESSLAITTDAPALSALVVAALDSETLFRRATRDVAADPELRPLLEQYADQRAAFALVLRANLGDTGQATLATTPHDKGGLLDANETIEVDLPVSVLDHCVQADRKLAAGYTRALAGVLSPELHVELERQLVAITDACDHLTSLDQAFRARALPGLYR